MLFLYLYIGYCLVKLYSVINVLSQQSLALSAIIFSIVVFFIWSFIPVLGYLLAKLIGAKGQSSGYVLFIIGVGVGLLENALFYLNVITPYQGDTGTLIVMGVFFITAYFSFKTPRCFTHNKA
ncbi:MULTISPECIES: hypothetical protein [unclassified Colwellia]|uniref:hypothetical protein n=1 Tax=unclassified Colwellia TaxID=196834 RepID=UPI0015F44E15|nr:MULTISPECIES: hypothetical protein [unclassified Colwellia]MBA6378170.1 hypothetical protein [Colwellia sp. BRX10-7]MBA6385571.1 hypothetical protein [Colwellia sp. BRX10-2]MBA6400600.1 hypothetical protein [Colwellia sp. BRX10-5]MBA6405472.1 hypothetical protein [Colwellia sp. BRX10-1]